MLPIILVYVGCENGDVFSYNYINNTSKIFSSRNGVRAEIVEQSVDGDLIAIGYSDGLTRVCDNDGRILKDLYGAGIINDLIINKSANILVTASTSKNVNIYNLSDLTSLPIQLSFERQVKDICLQEKSFDLFVSTGDNAIRKFPTQIESIIAVLNSKVNRQLSQEEWNTFIGEDIPYLSFVSAENKSTIK